MIPLINNVSSRSFLHTLSKCIHFVLLEILSANIQNYCISLTAREEVHFSPREKICLFSEILNISDVFLTIPIFLFPSAKSFFVNPSIYFRSRSPIL
jgi:hypothetical protein